MYLYVTDTRNCRVQKFTLEGEFVEAWGRDGSGFGEFTTPVGIAADSEGDIYVTETANRRIQKVSSKGEFLKTWGNGDSRNTKPVWGSQEYEDWEINRPWGVVTDNHGDVYVVDRFGDRIQKFTSEGRFLITWGKSGTDTGEFDDPHGIAIDKFGNVYVADKDNHRIQKFTQDGQFLASWGKQGLGKGEFNGPVDLAVDTTEDFFVFFSL